MTPLFFPYVPIPFIPFPGFFQAPAEDTSLELNRNVQVFQGPFHEGLAAESDEAGRPWTIFSHLEISKGDGLWQWIGLRENLQESLIFDWKIYGFL